MKLTFDPSNKYSIEEIEEFKNENDFMDSGVEFLKKTIELLYHITEHLFFDEENEPKKLSRNEAIIAGNLSRVIKLSTSFLQNTCEQKLDIAYIISRCHAETIVNLKYLLSEGEPNVKRNFIKHSLITEKELWNTIKENINDREGDIQDIEKRMQKSIKYAFEKSDFELDEVNKSSKWKSIKSRAEKVASPQFYSIFYGTASHSIHGNWQEIFRSNLNKLDNNEFTINLDWKKPRPQIIDAQNILNINLIQSISEHLIKEESIKLQIEEILAEWYIYSQALIENHEKVIEQSINES